MPLALSRGSLRPWRRGDEPSLVRYANNRNIWRNLRDRFPHPYTAADADAWITKAEADDHVARVLAEEAQVVPDRPHVRVGDEEAGKE